jgi:hypothetical protein
LRFTFRIAFVLVVVVGAITFAACDGEGTSRDLDAARDGGSGTVAPMVPSSDAQAEAPMSTMRIAHLAPDLGPIDFCYQGAKKGTFIGPVLGGVAPPSPTAPDADPDSASTDEIADATPEDDTSGEADAEGGTGLRSASYRTVSKYFNLQAAGPITLAILEAGARSCANALATTDVTLDPGKLSTVALFRRTGDEAVPLEVAAFTDDRTTQPDKIRVRVLHAALGSSGIASAGSLAVRVVASKTTVLADRVDPRRPATASEAVMVDGLGYVTAAPVPPPASIAIGPATTDGSAGFDPWQSSSADLELRGGSLHTAFVLTGASESTFEVLWCADLTTSGDQTACQLVH